MPIVNLFILLIFVWALMHVVLRSQNESPPLMISHRGAAGLAPENTLAGISKAIEEGAQFIEIDVQRSSDGVLVVLHDQTVDRTTDGTGEIGSMTWSEISQLNAAAYFTDQDAAEQIPTLDSVLELMKTHQAILIIEGKDPQLYPGIGQQILAAVQKHGLEERVQVISFDHPWLDQFRQLAPDIPLGYVSYYCGSGAKYPPDAFVDVFWGSVIADPTLVRRVHAGGRKVVVWTVDNPRLIKVLLWLGVDGITTNRPDLWRLVVKY